MNETQKVIAELENLEIDLFLNKKKTKHIEDAIELISRLAVKAAVFDALEEMVKTNLSVMLVKAVSSDDIFCVVSETFDKPHKDYQGPSLIEAINNANLDKK